MTANDDDAVRRRVLIIEAAEPLRRFVSVLLERFGYEVTAVDSGNAGLTHAGASDFDCIVLGSPAAVEAGGRPSTVLEQLERLAPHVASRLIVLTARVADRALLRRAVRMRVFAIFGDPFDLPVLTEAIRECVQGERPPRRFYSIPQPVVRLVCEAEGAPEVW